MAATSLRPSVGYAFSEMDGSDGWWVERDNPREGLDSWAVGAIPADGIRARVIWRVPAPQMRWLRLLIRRRGQ
jgi:hypothetical protein